MIYELPDRLTSYGGLTFTMGSKMKKIIYCLFILVLGACGGNSGGNETVSSTPEINMPDEPTFIPDDTDTPNIEEELTDAEILFGKGNGLDAIPTGLKTQTDAIGNSYLSFASWGNVYDIKHHVAKEASDIPFFMWLHPENYSFMETTTSKYGSNLNKSADVSVADATFTGPAIMKTYLRYTEIPEEGRSTTKNIYYSPDHGSMKLTFGHDKNDNVIEFIMHNPENNLVLRNSGASIFFDDNRDNVHVFYTLQNSQEPESHPVTTEMFKPATGYYYYEKQYEGYGSRQ